MEKASNSARKHSMEKASNSARKPGKTDSVARKVGHSVSLSCLVEGSQGILTRAGLVFALQVQRQASLERIPCPDPVDRLLHLPHPAVAAFDRVGCRRQ